MEDEIVGLIGAIILIITNIYMISRFLTKLELKPSREHIEEMIKESLEGHCPFASTIENSSGEKLEKLIDNRVVMHPVLREYGTTMYRINQLEPDVKEIKADIADIRLKIAEINTSAKQ